MTITDRLFIGINGRVVCYEHAGASLASSIRANPTAEHHVTDLDDWIAIDSDRAVCEHC